MLTTFNFENRMDGFIEIEFTRNLGKETSEPKCEIYVIDKYTFKKIWDSVNSIMTIGYIEANMHLERLQILIARFITEYEMFLIYKIKALNSELFQNYEFSLN